MTDLLDLMIANALLTIPFAIGVAIVARWINRPAAVHVLWVIVLLKLVCPQFYVVDVPGLTNAIDFFSLAHRIDTDQIATDRIPSSASTRVNRFGVIRSEAIESSSPGVNRWGRFGFEGGSSSANNSRSAIYSREKGTKMAHGAAGSVSYQAIIAVVWAVGSVTFVCLLGYRAWRFQGFVKRAASADDSLQELARSIAVRYGLRAAPRIRVASGSFPPLLWVLPGSASIVLPKQLISNLDSSALRNLLAHELAHFVRGDHWVRLLESVVLGICWWHPLAWWARRQLQHAEELCCDAWVMWAYPKSNVEYAKTLLATLDYLSAAPAALPPLATGLGRVGLIRRRFEMILHHESPRKLSACWGAAAAIIAVLILPCSTTVLARPHDDSANVDAEVPATEAERRPSPDAAVPRLIQAAIYQALNEAHARLMHAKPYMQPDVHADVLKSLTATLSAIDGITDEEITAITKHTVAAIKHFGLAVEGSSEVFARIMPPEKSPAVDSAEVAGHRVTRLVASALKAFRSARQSMSEAQSVVRASHGVVQSVTKQFEMQHEKATNLSVPDSPRPQPIEDR